MKKENICPYLDYANIQCLNKRNFYGKCAYICCPVIDIDAREHRYKSESIIFAGINNMTDWQKKEAIKQVKRLIYQEQPTSIRMTGN